VIEEETTGRLDFEALCDAIERRDPEVLIGFYAEDAELRVVNGGSAQGPPFELRGRAEIERYLRVVFGQRIPSHIAGEPVVGEDFIAFDEVCKYPDGTRVVVKTTLEIREGRISRQVDMVERAYRDGTSEGR
jgi:hypothetical protein